jgi:DNA polymerase-3 subunit epsilon
LILATDTHEIRISGSADMARRQRLLPLAPRLTESDREAHRAFIATLGDKPIWNDFLPG